MKMTLMGVVAPTALVAAGLGTAGYANSEGPAHAPERASHAVVKIADARLKFEINATDHDGGVQVFLDAEQWKRMSIFDPKGHRILTSVTKGIMAKQGGTELFLESAEPTFKELPLDELLDRWPAGRYAFRGVGLEGQRYVGAARLTHDLPKGPKLLSPLEGAGPQDADSTVVRWRRVPPPNGSPIIGYQVLVVQPDTGLKALPKVTLDVMMPPRANHLKVPRGFLQPGTEYEWEVLAIEKGGNQTLSSSTFKTKG
jgi:Fibronectin type III domain